MDKHVEPEQTADADKGDTLVLEKVSVISTMDDSLLMAHLRTMLGRPLSRPCSRPSRQSSRNRSGWNLPTELLYCPCSMHINEAIRYQAITRLNLQTIDLDNNPSLDQYSHFLRLEVECIKRRSEMNRGLRKIITLADEMVAIEKKIRTEYGAELDQLSTKVRQLFDERTALVRKRLARIKDQCSKVMANTRR